MSLVLERHGRRNRFHLPQDTVWMLPIIQTVSRFDTRFIYLLFSSFSLFEKFIIFLKFTVLSVNFFCYIFSVTLLYLFFEILYLLFILVWYNKKNNKLSLLFLCCINHFKFVAFIIFFSNEMIYLINLFNNFS